jgi:NlpC/P60 family putative phage cell wall peptidase
MTSPIPSAAVVAEAMSWIGTPYLHQGSVKGVGCDCLGLIRGVWRAVYGEEPEAAPGYTPDWAEANGAETLAEAAAVHMASVAVGDAGPGDVLLFRWRANLPAKHIAILVLGGKGSAPPRFVHAQQGAAVSLATLTPWWRRRAAYGFRFPGNVGSRQ